MNPFNQPNDGNDQSSSHEMNERDPINGTNQTSYMTGNGVGETSVESLNIDTMQVSHQEERSAGTARNYGHEKPGESDFWKYAEQVKSILAGEILRYTNG